MLRGVGVAMRRFPDRDHLEVAGQLEQWALGGRGAKKPVKDWPATYATFLRRTVPGEAPRLAVRAGERRPSSAPVDHRVPAATGSPAHTALQNLRVQLRKAVDAGDYTLWLEPLVAVDITSGGVLVLGAHRGIARTIHDRYGPLLTELADREVNVLALAALDERQAA